MLCLPTDVGFPRPLQHDRLVAVTDDSVLTVPKHPTRQHGTLHIGTQPNQVFDIVAVVDAHDVLLDVRAS